MRHVCRVAGLVFVFLLVCGLFVGVSVLGEAVLPPEENVWTEVASMRHERSYFGTVVVDGKIYVMGGIDKEGVKPGGSFGSPFAEVIGAVERYDPQTNTWMDMSPMPTPRCYSIAVNSMGKIYCIGGRSTPLGHPLAVNEVYDPVTDSWEKKAALPTPRTGVSACVVNGSIYVMSGIITTSGGWSYSKLCEVYDPVDDTWSVYDGPWPEVPSTSLVFDNRQYVCNGVWLQIYDFAGASWMYGPDVPGERQGRGIVAVDGLLYTLGGCIETHSFPFYMDTPERVSSRGVFVYTPFGYGRIPPEISILSLKEGGEYNFSNVTLEFSIRQPMVWMGYSLDGQANVTIEGNVTLPELSNGHHSVRMFAEDKYGNRGASETITFSVVNVSLVNAPLSMSFIVAVVVTVAVAVVVCGSLLFLFLRKHRR